MEVEEGKRKIGRTLLRLSKQARKSTVSRRMQNGKVQMPMNLLYQRLNQP